MDLQKESPTNDENQKHEPDQEDSSPKPLPDIIIINATDPQQPDNIIIDHQEDNNNNNNSQLQEESSPSLPPDLNKVSEEIDQYISDLSPADDDPLDVPIFVEQFALLVEAKMEELDSPSVKWSKLTEEDSNSFLKVVDRVCSLLNAILQFSSEYKYAHSINLVGRVLHHAMSYLEEEFKSLLEDYKIIIFPDSAEYVDKIIIKPKQSTSNQEDHQNQPTESEEEKYHFPGIYSDDVISNLARLSKAMIDGGYEKECCEVYFVARRNALEETIHKLGFEKYSIDDVQKMNWESLEREIVAWIRTINQCTTVHFPRERNLAVSVFPDHHPSMFESLAYCVMTQLLNFAEAVSLTKRAAEKLFKFLDLYEALRDIPPTTDTFFPQDLDLARELKTEASMIRSHLGEAMVLIFVELENSINSDSGKTPVPGGAVHPLTRYIMNYLKYAIEYKETLEQVFREHQKIERADSATGSDFDYNSQAAAQNEIIRAKESPFQAQMIKVMDLLDSNLEGKSKVYRDPSLSMIFMMNNGRYIMQKIKGSNEINSLMGNTWCRKRSSDLRQYHRGYQRETWGKLLGCLHPEGLTVNGKVAKPALKERFKSFNAMFDEIHKTQSSWVVSDEQLQSELRVSISNMVIPAYRSFLGRFSQVFTPGRQTEKYVKYQAEDIETYIDELFDGNASPMGRKL
ncbi:exocyst complex component EXO70C2-like [Henckelia pumila]|uniref:exocyst complex component EXO70C2-like n=1 Tax=Henckelia pumila TaxID=405737 RepID=UPI003C6E0229